MILYTNIEKILQHNAKAGMEVLEIGAAPNLYLTGRSDLKLTRSNLVYSQGIDKVFDAEMIPFSENSFDLVFMVAVDYFIPNLQKSMDEIYRVLKTNGKLFIFSYKMGTLSKLKKVNQRAGKTSFVYSKEDYKKILKRSGFRVYFSSVASNPPSHPLKAILFQTTPEFIKRHISHWQVIHGVKL